MSESEKIKEIPKQPQEQAKEPSVPKTSQSAFDRVLEQSRVMQQNPLMQNKASDQGAQDQKVKEVLRRDDRDEGRRKSEEKDETGTREKIKFKREGSETATREGIGRTAEKKGFGGGSSGGRGGGFGGELSKRHSAIINRKIADAKAFIGQVGQGEFANKLAQAKASETKLSTQQMQAIVNQIVQAIRVGKNEVGQSELQLTFQGRIFSGLRLRLVSKHGKVSVQFQAATRESHDLFVAESAKIKKELEAKGVAVAEVKVTRT